MVAASVAFFGAPPGESLHSHITGVLPGSGRGIGGALKWHQRAWALDRALYRATWTYDPLIARNAFFNVTRLGARPKRYLVDFYGPMDDGPNRGQPTDRVDVEWDLLAEDAVRAASAVLDPVAMSDGPDVDALRAAGAVVALSVGSDGEPAVGGPAAGGSVVGGSAVGAAAAGRVLVGLPADIEAVRRSDQARALRWRLALRDVLGSLLADDGWRVTGFAKSGWYVLDREGPA
jgi:predicted GNAT superfamily acetyltransferase